MTFWFITTAISALIALVLGRALLKAGDAAALDTVNYDLKVYRDQLEEVARDVARGIIAEEDAERARTEISRRILQTEAARQNAVTAQPASSGITFAFVAAVLVGGSLGLYSLFGQPGYGDLSLKDRIAFAEDLRENRPDQQTAVDGLPPQVPLENLSDEFESLMVRLRETVASRPNDIEGHVLLAQNEARLGNYMAAAEAQSVVLRLKGEERTASDIADFGELLVTAAGGYVSPEAETAFRAALSLEESDERSRYFLGLMMYQTGRPDIAFRLWDALLRRGPENAPWIAPILAQIEQVAQLAGVNYAIPAIGAGASPGPSLEDMQAAAEMTAEERMEMIGGMVAGLTDRLANEGGPPQDWARLITSLSILGQPNDARAIFDNAMEVYANEPGAIDIIRKAGQDAGVAE